MTGLVLAPSDLSRVEGILGALGAALPDAETGKLRAFLAGEGPLDVGDADAGRIVDALKTAADRHWRIDPHRSVELAEAIIAIGVARDGTWIRALGTMAKGDAVKFIGSQQEAWDLLEEAARLFSSIDDEVGWARTWIGRVFVAAQLNRLAEAIAQAEYARTIFERHGETQRQLRIDMALGEVSYLVKDLSAAELHNHRALDLALVLGERGQAEARAIYNNLGLVALARGDPLVALGFYEQAAGLAAANGEETAEAICMLNIAMARMELGQYRQALAQLNDIRPRYRLLFGTDTQIQTEMAECLMALHQYAEAAALCRQARQEWLAANAGLFAARTALLQAMAEAADGNLAVARSLLDATEQEFVRLGDTGLAAMVQLRRGELALRERDAGRALSLGQICGARFAAMRQVPLQIEALLLEGTALQALDRLDDAARALGQAPARARECASPALLYSAHLALGRLAERQGRPARALRRYAAAEAVLERLQRNLTVTLRPAFLASALDAQRARAILLLSQGKVAAAFETVERVRAQIALGYLSGRESLAWAASDPAAAPLAAELDELRGRYHALTTRADDAMDQRESRATGSRPSEAITALERQMRAVTEQLHLRRPSDAPDALDAPKVAQLQAALDPCEAMIAYFDDGAHLRAFYIDRGRIEHIGLDTDAIQLGRLMDQLARNVNRALLVGSGQAARTLLKPVQVILTRLWEMLFAPVAALTRGKSRLYIIPYGQLHELPFNLLYDGERYLIENVEIVTLPNASLLLRPPPARAPGARVIVHDDAGRLPDVEREAEVLQLLYPTVVLRGGNAGREALKTPPGQILHVAAHGAYRTDNPDFSHIALADGRVMIDELLQLDLSYELVTLSACETGRGRVTAGDEALGIGWAFLYAGAGAVVSSLWRVSDARTAPLMACFYSA
ncbi:MAG: CHAT domain-containing protein, partial [Thermoflexales bacterium]